MPELSVQRSRANGYFILPLLCVLGALFSMWINSLYNKIKNKRKGVVVKSQFKWTLIILPLILGLFALLYNSVFAIYLFTGQIVSALVSPIQLLIVDKIIDKQKKKEEDKTIVEYSRKF